MKIMQKTWRFGCFWELHCFYLSSSPAAIRWTGAEPLIPWFSGSLSDICCTDTALTDRLLKAVIEWRQSIGPVCQRAPPPPPPPPLPPPKRQPFSQVTACARYSHTSPKAPFPCDTMTEFTAVYWHRWTWCYFLFHWSLSTQSVAGSNMLHEGDPFGSTDRSAGICYITVTAAYRSRASWRFLKTGKWEWDRVNTS